LSRSSRSTNYATYIGYFTQNNLLFCENPFKKFLKGYVLDNIIPKQLKSSGQLKFNRTIISN